ncbi:hypothetical protein EJB05_35835, partial [Eragrostis curvula]
MAEMVAGLLTSAVVNIVCDKLSTALGEQAGLALKFSDDLEEMKDTMESIAAVVKDAEQQSVRKEEESVRLWLKRLKHAALDISDMMDDYDTDAKVPGMFSCIAGGCKKMALANKMRKMRQKIERINKQREHFGFIAGNNAAAIPDQQVYDVRETTSAVNEENILGREEEKEKITDILSASNKKDGTMILPIYGLGGMGKSTLAQLIYNDTQFKQYTHRAWVYVSEKFDLKEIGRSIISQLGGQQNTDSLQMVHQCLDNLLPGNSILIILDDIWVEDDSELEKLKTMLHVNKKGSMVDVIVTTRSESIAKRICTGDAHKLQPLEDDLCWDIIKKYSGFEDKSNKGNLELVGLDIARKCGGVPLAAQAIGYVLNSKDIHGWREVNNSDIWKQSYAVDDSQHKVLPSLMLSYDRMLPILKVCFSYCAIFPKGHDIFEDDLIHQWVALDFIKKPSQGKEHINHLLGMSFLQPSKLDSDYRGTRYTMHDLVHDLAVSVIGDEVIVIDAAKTKSNNTNRQKYCRYVRIINYDGQSRLSDIISKKVRALHFSSTGKMLGLRDASFSFAKCLRVLHFSGCLGTTLPSSIGHLNQLRCLIAPQVQTMMLLESVTKLSKLQYLNLRGSSEMTPLPESLGKLGGLIYIGLSHCSGLLKLPEELFCELKSLTHLDMYGCSGIKVLPESFGGLKSLTHLYMKGCSGITVLPESFGGLESLTHLDMDGRSGITVLPESFGGLKSLTHLDMDGCSGITILPESFGGLKSLTTLYMNGCSGITILPESFGGLKSLTTLYMNGCFRITVLPESFAGLKSLTTLYMNGCSGITVLPESFAGLKSLAHLYMNGCFGITVLPESFGGLKSLAHLDMNNCSGITVLPESFGGLKSLTTLYMNRCSGITVLPESFAGLKSLTTLYMNGCSGITVLPESFARLKSLAHLYMNGCFGITVLPESFGGLKSLAHLDMNNCSGITVLPESFGGLKSLTTLYMNRCSGITVLPESFGGLKSLTTLYMNGCSGITVLPESFGGLKCLTHLGMDGCSGITVLSESFGGLKNLTHLGMDSCSGITVLPESFGGLKSLTHLGMDGCSGITVLSESFGGLKSLTHLGMDSCSGITVLPESFGGLKSLTNLDMNGCSGITVLPESFGGLKSLTTLYMNGCSGITVLPESFGGLKSLTTLYMNGCSGITVLPESFGGLKSLTHLDMDGCSGITVLPESFGGLKCLTHLYMNGCSGITVLPESFGGLKCLTHLMIDGCSEITVLPESFGGLKSLTHLCMDGCSGITVLPESFGGLKSLTHLSMDGCSGITVLPESFGGLKSLTTLYMNDWSGITVLPESFGGLKSLTRLYMNDCSGITVLPESFGGLKSLTRLYMNDCSGITVLPESFGGLESLTLLNILGASENYVQVLRLEAGRQDLDSSRRSRTSTPHVVPLAVPGVVHFKAYDQDQEDVVPIPTSRLQRRSNRPSIFVEPDVLSGTATATPSSSGCPPQGSSAALFFKGTKPFLFFLVIKTGAFVAIALFSLSVCFHEITCTGLL